MNFVIGTPGSAPRLFLSVPRADAERQMAGGEVLFESGAQPGRWIIAADGQGLEPVPVPIDELKRRLWLKARDIRDQRASDGCATPYGRVDSDPESRSKISGGSTAAIASKGAGIPFSVDWTMEDNSIVTLDADAMIAVGLSVMQHVAVCQQIGTGIRDQISAATTEADLAAIDLEAGYPDAAA